MERQALTRLSPPEILAALHDALRAEQQAVVDYGAHAQASQSPTIQETLEALQDVELAHARRLASRIEALGGWPTQHALHPQPAGDDLRSWLENDLRGEQWAINEYARLVAGTLDDEETAELMAELLVDEMRHARWLKATLMAPHEG
jgi:bacterioferritin (cytochrome b1)